MGSLSENFDFNLGRDNEKISYESVDKKSLP